MSMRKPWTARPVNGPRLAHQEERGTFKALVIAWDDATDGERIRLLREQATPELLQKALAPAPVAVRT
jgi:hypothetical protein